MPTRRELLQGLVCLPLAAQLALDSGAPRAPAKDADSGRPGRGYACALGEDADATLLPASRRVGEHLALALSGTAKPAADVLAKQSGSADAAWIELSPADRGGVDDGPLAERIRTAASVSLIEGGVLDWLVTLWPARRRSAVLQAIGECAYTGGRVIGRGSTAFLVAGGGVVNGPTHDAIGESRLRLTDPHASGQQRMAVGLGLCGDFLVDTQARANGSLLRLLSTMFEQHVDHGVFLGAGSALCGDLETKAWVALGPEALLYLDLSGSRRESRSIEGARLSTLCAGDGWSRRERGLFSTGEAANFGASAEEVRVADALLANALCAPPSARKIWRDDRARVELRQDFDSRAFSGPGAAQARGQRLRLDVALERGRFGEL